MLEFLTRARLAGIWTASAVLCGYVLTPWLVALNGGDTELTAIVGMSLLSVAGILAGFYLPLGLAKLRWKRVVVGLNVVVVLIWLPFVVFVIIALLTAQKIPIVAALQGANPEELAMLRETFLKARGGWQEEFSYISLIFCGALIPYTLALLFLHKVRGRWIFFSFFLLYAVSFVEKAYFLKGALPLFYLVAQRQVKTPLNPRIAFAGILALLVIVTSISGSGGIESDKNGDFFSMAYVRHGSVDHVVWRAVAVPVVTAADAIRYFEEHYDGKYLKGATSGMLATVFGLERIRFEREVFEAEMGQNETQTGSANSAFFTEAYVNFGYPGVIGFALVAGLILQAFSRATDEAFRSLWILFCFGIYNAGLIGLLFSNGFILIFLLALLFRTTVPVKDAELDPGLQQA
jgi:hypothetical protein